MLKTSKRYVINTNTVNNYGYRVISEGIDLSDYNNNPVMPWMHYRPTGASKDEVLCLGNVKEIRIDSNGVMTGQPYFDETDPFAVSIYNKYENGTYNMLSLCAQPIESSTEPKDMLPGQTGPTFTKTKAKEISCVDIGGNPKAHGVTLCDANGKIISLSDSGVQSIIKNNSSSMTSANDAYSPEISQILNNAVAVGKFSRDEADNLLKLAKDKDSANTVKSLIAVTKINPNRIDGLYPPVIVKHAASSYDDLSMNKSGDFTLRSMKAHAPEIYKSKFFEKHGRMPSDLAM